MGSDLSSSPDELKERSRKELGLRLGSFYPVLLTDEVEKSSNFFTEHMGFKEVFKCDRYVSLIHGGNDAYELAIISHDHDTIPEAHRQPTSTLLLNFEVPSVESEYERLLASGVEILQPIENLPFRQLHFICRGPGGIMVDVIEVIPPDPEYAGQYVS